jgi:hypothetical protein
MKDSINDGDGYDDLSTVPSMPRAKGMRNLVRSTTELEEGHLLCALVISKNPNRETWVIAHVEIY